jgi:putative PIN family toxin of toxin-antitoxin system
VVRVVLDTNVVVSALLWRGTPYSLLETVRRHERIRLFSSPALLTELAEVLVRPWAAARFVVIGLAPRDVLAYYISAIEIVTPTSIPAVVAADPDDDHVIAAAVAARAELIIPGDSDLLGLGSYGNILILKAADALQHLGRTA